MVAENAQGLRLPIIACTVFSNGAQAQFINRKFIEKLVVGCWLVEPSPTHAGAASALLV